MFLIQCVFSEQLLNNAADDDDVLHVKR